MTGMSCAVKTSGSILVIEGFVPGHLVLKEKRRFCTRNHKLASRFKAMVVLACIERCLRADFSGNP